MPTNTASDKRCKSKSSLSSSELTRHPLRWDGTEENEEAIDSKSSTHLYPTEELEEDLEEIQKQTEQNKSKRQQKKHLPKQEVKSEGEASKSSNFWSLKIVIFLCTLVTTLFGIYFYQSEKSTAVRAMDLTEFISDLKNKFERQDHQTFQILKSSLKKVFNENSKPVAPSIFTIIANKEAETTASDFSTHIARKLASKNFVLIDESVMHRDPDTLKYVIDTEIKSKFDNKTLNVAVVDRFHNIPIGAAMIFHTYCDHETAPFKRAIFLFIVHLNRKIPENSSLKYIDKAAMEALRYIWSDASDDIVDSLITRLTGNVINIK